MPDNRRISSPKIIPRSSWSSENLPTIEQEQRAVIRKFINSAVYVEKSVMPPLRKKSPIEINSLSDNEGTLRTISTDRSVKRCRCSTSPESCPCHPTNDQMNETRNEKNSEPSTSSSSDLGSQITVKSKEQLNHTPEELKLSLSSLNTNRTTFIDPKEKEEYIKNWLRRKDEVKKKKEIEEQKIKFIKEKQKQMILEKEQENFKKWLANKKMEEEKVKAEKDRKEREKKQKDMEIEQRRAMNQATYNQWLNRKKRVELERKIREKLALLEVLEEKQKRLEASQKAFEDWLRTSKSKPKPVPLNQGLKSLCSSTSVTYINPVPWIPNFEFSQKTLQK